MAMPLAGAADVALLGQSNRENTTCTPRPLPTSAIQRCLRPPLLSNRYVANTADRRDGRFRNSAQPEVSESLSRATEIQENERVMNGHSTQMNNIGETMMSATSRCRRSAGEHRRRARARNTPSSISTAKRRGA